MARHEVENVCPDSGEKTHKNTEQPADGKKLFSVVLYGLPFPVLCYAVMGNFSWTDLYLALKFETFFFVIGFVLLWIVGCLMARWVFEE